MIRGKNKSKGQITAEYLIILAGVILVAFIFMAKEGPFDQTYNAILEAEIQHISDTAENIF